MTHLESWFNHICVFIVPNPSIVRLHQLLIEIARLRINDMTIIRFCCNTRNTTNALHGDSCGIQVLLELVEGNHHTKTENGLKEVFECDKFFTIARK